LEVFWYSFGTVEQLLANERGKRQSQSTESDAQYRISQAGNAWTEQANLHPK
jgi:hypothetical protein